jgi:hypothetical protein
MTLKSTIAVCASRTILTLVLLIFACACLLLSSCSNQGGGTINTANVAPTSSPKAVPGEETVSTQEIEELKKLNPDDLLKEIRARERKTALDVPDVILEKRREEITHQPFLADPKTSPTLEKYSSLALTLALLDSQKAIYGQDNRKDVFMVSSDPKINAAADAVVSLFQSNRLASLEDGTRTKIINKVFATEYRLCDTASPVEPYLSQPCSAFCSGVLVAPDIIATAGHCINTPAIGTPPLNEIRFVFGYRMRDENTAQLIIDNNEVYIGEQIIKRVYTPDGADWALVRLSRPVQGHTPVSIRRTAKVSDADDLYVIGHPCGLPAKFADGAIVRANTDANFFVANLDTYGGNSGSPVFNRTTHQVEGILVRGEKDFIVRDTPPSSCRVSLRCPNTGCRGEDCTRTTLFASLVPGP